MKASENRQGSGGAREGVGTGAGGSGGNNLLGRIRAFLPKIEAANRDLEATAGDGDNGDAASAVGRAALDASLVRCGSDDSDGSSSSSSSLSSPLEEDDSETSRSGESSSSSEYGDDANASPPSTSKSGADVTRGQTAVPAAASSSQKSKKKRRKERSGRKIEMTIAFGDFGGESGGEAGGGRGSGKEGGGNTLLGLLADDDKEDSDDGKSDEDGDDGEEDGDHNRTKKVKKEEVVANLLKGNPAQPRRQLMAAVDTNEKSIKRRKVLIEEIS